MDIEWKLKVWGFVVLGFQDLSLGSDFRVLGGFRIRGVCGL